MPSRQRKKRNQRANKAKAMSSTSVASLLKDAHGPNGCMYGVHSFEYHDHGNDYWTKRCITNNPGTGVCGATYQVHGAELDWVKQQPGNSPIRGVSTDG